MHSHPFSRPILTGIGLAALALFLAACTRQHPGTPEVAYSAPATRAGAAIGTFDRQALVMAFYRSRPLHEHLADLKRQQDAARARGDTAEVDRLESVGAGLQDLAHRQLEGKAPLTNIFETIGQPNLAAIARDAGVGSIASAAPAGAQAVDVTARLTAHLPPVK